MEPRDHFVAMEGSGAYNANSALQASGASLAVPLLEEAARAVPFAGDDRAIVIADYGSSEGRNSAAVIRAALAVLRERFGKHKSVIVAHTDLPTNDFNTLFKVVETESDGYAHDDDTAFPMAIGRSFYRLLLPDGHVDLGWSSYATQWLSRTPCLIAGHIHSERGTKAEQEAFAAQARTDWQSFLLLRAREFRPGARLVIAMPARDTGRSLLLLPLFDAAVQAVADMEAEGLVSASERAGMVIPVSIRDYEELREPFETAAVRTRWRAVKISIEPIIETAHEHFLRDGNAESLATKRAAFFRATFGPVLASALTPNRTEADRGKFLRELEGRLRERIVSLQEKFDSRVAVLSLERL